MDRYGNKEIKRIIMAVLCVLGYGYNRSNEMAAELALQVPSAESIWIEIRERDRTFFLRRRTCKRKGTSGKIRIFCLVCKREPGNPSSFGSRTVVKRSDTEFIFIFSQKKGKGRRGENKRTDTKAGALYGVFYRGGF